MTEASKSRSQVIDALAKASPPIAEAANAIEAEITKGLLTSKEQSALTCVVQGLRGFGLILISTEAIFTECAKAPNAPEN